jgi:hypothetical protein
MGRERFRGNRRSRKLRKESRTIPLWGSKERGGGEDHDKWYTCWFCGWKCNVDRDALGDGQSKDGVVLEDYAQQPDPGYSYSQNESGIAKNNFQAVLGGSINAFQVAAEQDSAGDNKGVRNAIRVSEKSFGCPLCHSLNWRGDY